jgi:hypothetical protein
MSIGQAYADILTVLAICGIRQPGLAFENSSSCLVLLADSPDVGEHARCIHSLIFTKG